MTLFFDTFFTNRVGISRRLRKQQIFYGALMCVFPHKCVFTNLKSLPQTIGKVSVYFALCFCQQLAWYILPKLFRTSHQRLKFSHSLRTYKYPNEIQSLDKRKKWVGEPECYFMHIDSLDRLSMSMQKTGCYRIIEPKV